MFWAKRDMEKGGQGRDRVAGRDRVKIKANGVFLLPQLVFRKRFDTIIYLEGYSSALTRNFKSYLSRKPTESGSLPLLSFPSRLRLLIRGRWPTMDCSPQNVLRPQIILRSHAQLVF